MFGVVVDGVALCVGFVLVLDFAFAVVICLVAFVVVDLFSVRGVVWWFAWGVSCIRKSFCRCLFG